jgi:hypothetical protein
MFRPSLSWNLVENGPSKILTFDIDGDTCSRAFVTESYNLNYIFDSTNIFS